MLPLDLLPRLCGLCCAGLLHNLIMWLPAPLLPAVPGEVHAAKEYGLLCDLEAHADVVGLAALHQVGGLGCTLWQLRLGGVWRQSMYEIKAACEGGCQSHHCSPLPVC